MLEAGGGGWSSLIKHLLCTRPLVGLTSFTAVAVGRGTVSAIYSSKETEAQMKTGWKEGTRLELWWRLWSPEQQLP